MVNPNDVKKLREMTGSGVLDCRNALEATNNDIDKAIDWLRERGITKAANKAERIAAEGLCNIVINGNKALILELNSETDFVAKNAEFKAFLDKISNIIVNSAANNLEAALVINTDEGSINDLITNFTAKIGERINLRRLTVITKQDNELFGSYLHMGGKIAVLTLIEGSNEEVAKDVAMQAAAMNFKAIRREELSQEEIEHERGILREQALNEGKPADIVEKMLDGRMNKFYKEVCLEEQVFIKNNDITIKQYIDSFNCKIKQVIRYEVGEGVEKRQDNFAEEVMNQIKN